LSEESKSRRQRREEARELAKEIIRSGKTKPPAAKLDVGWFLALFMALALLLLASKIGRPITCIVLVLMVACLIHPITQLPIVRGAASTATKTAWFVGLMLMAIAVIAAFGIYVWPPLPYYRTLSVKDRENFMNILKSVREPRETLVVQCPTSNEALCTIATEYLEMFQASGWRTPTGGVERTLYIKALPGVTISKKPQPGDLDPNDVVHGLWVLQSPSLVTVENAFKAIRIGTTQKSGMNLPENTISIYFGQPPESK
jgi:hypothetical protein